MGISNALYSGVSGLNTNGQAITLAMKHKDNRDPKNWKGFKFAVPFEFSDLVLETAKGPRRALVMSPEREYRVGLERLEALRASLRGRTLRDLVRPPAP